jgi:hypothetical protein
VIIATTQAQPQLTDAEKAAIHAEVDAYMSRSKSQSMPSNVVNYGIIRQDASTVNAQNSFTLSTTHTLTKQWFMIVRFASVDVEHSPTCEYNNVEIGGLYRFCNSVDGLQVSMSFDGGDFVITKALDEFFYLEFPAGTRPEITSSFDAGLTGNGYQLAWTLFSSQINDCKIDWFGSPFPTSVNRCGDVCFMEFQKCDQRFDCADGSDEIEACPIVPLAPVFAMDFDGTWRVKKSASQCDAAKCFCFSPATASSGRIDVNSSNRVFRLRGFHFMWQGESVPDAHSALVSRTLEHEQSAGPSSSITWGSSQNVYKLRGDGTMSDGCGYVFEKVPKA